MQSRDTGGSDSEREDIELADIKKVLDKHDPGFMRAQALPTHDPASGGGGIASLYQLSLGVERFRWGGTSRIYFRGLGGHFPTKFPCPLWNKT